jgi:predicted AlkP superfamily phosphohydrolase/phosphomutase
VVLGFDAMDTDLALQLVSEGRMPALASLLDTSAWARTRTPPGLVVGAIWPSITTGCSPDRHGFYSDYQLAPGTYDARPAGPWLVETPRIWDTLSAAGKECAVVDVPLTTTATGLRGEQLVEWGSHDRFVVPTESSPTTLVADIRARFGEYPVQPRCDGYANDLPALRDALLRAIDARRDLIADFLDRHPADFSMFAFSESHCAGHHLWRIHDPAHPDHDAELRAELGDALELVYEALDAALAQLLEHVPDDAALAVVCSHGIGAHYDGNHLLRKVCRRLDTLDRPSPVRDFRERAIKRTRRRRLAAEHSYGLDGARRYFWVPNNDAYGAIRVNLRGREPRGLVKRGAEADALAREIRADLLALENPDTGEPAIVDVMLTSELYDGPRRNVLPDLLVDWNRSRPIRAVRSAKLGEIRQEPHPLRSGDHRPGGLFALRSPGLATGPRSERVPVEDLAPTLAALLGVELPGIDGTPWSAPSPSGSPEPATV